MSEELDRREFKPVPDQLKATSNAVTTQHIIGERIRQLRGQRSWSARELAEQCEHPLLTRGTIAKIESGQRTFVTYAELDALAAAFGLSRSDLLPGCQT